VGQHRGQIAVILVLREAGERRKRDRHDEQDPDPLDARLPSLAAHARERVTPQHKRGGAPVTSGLQRNHGALD
jgi:hypothetical protein